MAERPDAPERLLEGVPRLIELADRIETLRDDIEMTYEQAATAGFSRAQLDLLLAARKRRRDEDCAALLRRLEKRS